MTPGPPTFPHRSVVPGLDTLPGRCPYRMAFYFSSFDVSPSIEVQVMTEFM
jgi:hypothetical protein